MQWRKRESILVPISKIRAWRFRKYGVVEDRILFWMNELKNPQNWRGFVAARRLPDGTYELLAGHHRLEAVKRLGWTEFPLEVADYTDEEAAHIYNTDNHMNFAPTAGMIIESSKPSFDLYVSKGRSQDEAREVVRKEMGLESIRQLLTIFEMREALAAGTLTGSIQNVLDPFAAIKFWNLTLKWKKEFGETFSLSRQAEILASCSQKDLRAEVGRKFSDLILKKRKVIAQESSTGVVQPVSKPRKVVSLNELLINLCNQMWRAAHLEGDVDSEVVENLRAQWSNLDGVLRKAEIEGEIDAENSDVEAQVANKN